MVIYHYPLIWVIFMVILLIFIIQNYPNFFSKYYPKFTIRVIYPFTVMLIEMPRFQYIYYSSTIIEAILLIFQICTV